MIAIRYTRVIPRSGKIFPVSGYTGIDRPTSECRKEFLDRTGGCLGTRIPVRTVARIRGTGASRAARDNRAASS